MQNQDQDNNLTHIQAHIQDIEETSDHEEQSNATDNDIEKNKVVELPPYTKKLLSFAKQEGLYLIDLLRGKAELSHLPPLSWLNKSKNSESDGEHTEQKNYVPSLFIRALSFVCKLIVGIVLGLRYVICSVVGFLATPLVLLSEGVTLGVLDRI